MHACHRPVLRCTCHPFVGETSRRYCNFMDGKACASVALQRTRRENLFPPLQKCMLDACATRWWQRRGRPPAAQLRICLLRICLLLLWFPYNSLDFFHCTHGKDQNKCGALPRRAQEETSATPALVCQPQSQGREDSSQSMRDIILRRSVLAHMLPVCKSSNVSSA